MKYIPQKWSEQHKELKGLLSKKESWQEGIELMLKLHGQLHMPEVSRSSEDNLFLPLLSDLKPEDYAIMPTKKDETIAWVLWHLARIEDLTMCILVCGGKQVFNTSWATKIHAGIIDTGNALSDEEIIRLSMQISIPALLEYRSTVGKRTRDIVHALAFEERKRKVAKENLDRIMEEGGLTRQKESAWLLDYWGKKDVTGLLLMPATRHMAMHLNDCYKWKEKIIRKRENI